MTPDELRDAIRRRAGVRRRAIPVRICTLERLLPPTLRPIGHHNSQQREVVVSATWLRCKEPELWAAYVAARLLDLPSRLTITTFKEER